jgi:hypothetical protein
MFTTRVSFSLSAEAQVFMLLDSQPSEEITPFQSITVVLRHNEKTRKTISINGHILPCIHEKNKKFLGITLF